MHCDTEEVIIVEERQEKLFRGKVKLSFRLYKKTSKAYITDKLNYVISEWFHKKRWK